MLYKPITQDGLLRMVREVLEGSHVTDHRLHEYFFSSSSKNAFASRTKSASVSLTASPGSSLSTDFSGGSLIPEPVLRQNLGRRASP